MFPMEQKMFSDKQFFQIEQKLVTNNQTFKQLSI